jgi:hypothetical protein
MIADTKSNFYATEGYDTGSEGANLQVTCTDRRSEPERAPEGGHIRLVRSALALALASTALALATPSAGSAATPPTPTRIVLFNGNDATPVGPAVQPAGKWTVSTAPARITTTDFGTLVEDTGLGSIGACPPSAASGGKTPRPSAVQLQEFSWDQTNGQRVLATNLGPALANNNEWAYLVNGTSHHWPVVAGDGRQ